MLLFLSYEKVDQRIKTMIMIIMIMIIMIMNKNSIIVSST